MLAINDILNTGVSSLFTVENVAEKETVGCLGVREGGRGGCSAASGVRRGCWAGRGDQQLQQQGRGRLGEDSRDLGVGLQAREGRGRGSYSQARAQGTAAARC